MSQSESTREHFFDAPPARVAPLGTRVDTAHVSAVEVLPPVVPAEAPLASEAGYASESRLSSPARGELSVAVTIQQMRQQAAQLAAHLQRQQSSVDHREAELNARLAAMENQVRGARLWLHEHHGEISQQKADIARREQELAKREAQLAAETKKSRGVFRGRARSSVEEADLLERSAELDRRQAEIDAMRDRLAAQVTAAKDVEESQQALVALEGRYQALERAEKLLAIEQTELERHRHTLAEERAAFAEQMHGDRARLLNEQQRAAAEQEKIRHDLKRQSDELSARQAVIERMRADMSRSQQEVLEIRLATEELWARLCGSMAPATLTQSLAQIRLKLADEQRLARGELAQQKAEIQALSARLAEQHRKLAHRRDDVQAWANERQRDLEKQAGLLIAGQQQMAEERAAFKQASEAWQNERFRLQQEVRRLLRQLNRPEPVAA